MKLSAPGKCFSQRAGRLVPASRCEDRQAAPALPTKKCAVAEFLKDLGPDILVPQFRTSADELPHQLNAFGILHDFDAHTALPKIFFRGLERDIFPDDDVRDFIQKDRAAAHRAGGEGGVKRAARVNRCPLATGILQTIHLGVLNDAAALDALIVPAADDLSIAHQHRPDRDAVFAQTFSGFFNCALEKMIDGSV